MRSIVAALVLCTVWNAAAAYDPLAVDKTKPQTHDLVVKDAKRDREIPILVYLPKADSPAPVVVFSHGLGGTRNGSAFLGNHWAARGYVAVFVQHPGSDEGVWKDKPLKDRMPEMRKAASAENFLLRVRDAPVVLDQLDVWNKSSDHAIKGRLDMSQVGMSGHSFGAVTTQAISGQTFPIGPSLTDSRIKAAVVMSPSIPNSGDPKRAFSEVKIPWMLLTGTKDNAPIGQSDAESRLLVFPALPAGNKYELVLDNAEHSVFTERKLPGETEPRNPNHHRAIMAVTTAFWDAYLKKDDAARKWLDGEDAAKVLDKSDRWQKK